MIAKSGRNILETIAEICSLVDGPVSAEVTATDFKTMLTEGQKLAAIAPNVTVKVPLTRDGLMTCRALSDAGTDVNVTLCFTAGQALLAAKAGAKFISPFVGRLDDIGRDGMGLIEEICSIYANYDFDTEVLVASVRSTQNLGIEIIICIDAANHDFDTEVLVASVRSTQHVVDAALMGADVVTLPPKILTALYHHPLTDSGLDAFLKDWKATGQSIL